MSNLPDILNDQIVDIEILSEDEEIKKLNKNLQEYINLGNRLNELSYNESYKKNSTIRKQQIHVEEIYYYEDRIFRRLERGGSCIWQDIEGSYFFRANINSSIQSGTKSKISKIISNYIGKNILIIDNLNDIKSRENGFFPIYIFSTSIRIIQGDLFYPFSNTEFFHLDNSFYRNTFQSTYYLRQYDNILSDKDSFINDFIFHLSKDYKSYCYIISWLSSFYCTFKKTEIALCLLGDNEVIENIFFNEIIRPIFGSKNCITIDNDTLGKPLSSIIENKLFYHIGELSSDNYNGKKIKKLLRTVLLDESIETYDADIDKSIETFIYGATLITSSVPYKFIKDSFSNCSVFEVNYLDEILINLKIKDLTSLYSNIKNDLSNFSNFLASSATKFSSSYKVYNSREKLELAKTEDLKIEDFIYSIKSKKLNYFKKIKFENIELYLELKEDLFNGLIKQSNLSNYFNVLYKDCVFSSNIKFIQKLKEKDMIFNKETESKNKAKYYRIS